MLSRVTSCTPRSKAHWNQVVSRVLPVPPADTDEHHARREDALVPRAGLGAGLEAGKW